MDSYKSKVEGKEEIEDELKDLVKICLENGVGTNSSHGPSSSSKRYDGPPAPTTRGLPSKQAQAASNSHGIVQRITDWVDPDQSGV
jgi:hypothetical protein